MTKAFDKFVSTLRSIQHDAITDIRSQPRFCLRVSRLLAIAHNGMSSVAEQEHLSSCSKCQVRLTELRDFADSSDKSDQSVLCPSSVSEASLVPVKRKLGLYVSQRCQHPTPYGRPAFEFRMFVRNYWSILSSYTLLVSEFTATIMHEVAANLGIKPNWNLEVSNNSRALAIELQTHKMDCDRLLLFLDSDGLKEEWATLWIIRQSAAENGQKLNINVGAQLWAQKELVIRDGRQAPPRIGADDAIVLVGEESARAIEQFALKHLNAFMLFPRCIMASPTRETEAAFWKTTHRSSDLLTGTSELVLESATTLVRNHFNAISRGVRDKLCHVIAFADYSRSQVPQNSFEQFLVTCADPRMRVNLLLNKTSAEEWIHRLEVPGAYCGGPPDSEP